MGRGEDGINRAQELGSAVAVMHAGSCMEVLDHLIVIPETHITLYANWN